MATTEGVRPSTGRRKTGVARVRLLAGSGKHTINGRPPLDYLKRETLVQSAFHALTVANVAGKFDAYVAGWRFNGKLDLGSIFGGAALPPNGSNVVSYRSAEADRLLDAIGKAPDWTTAKAAYVGRYRNETAPAK